MLPGITLPLVLFLILLLSWLLLDVILMAL